MTKVDTRKKKMNNNNPEKPIKRKIDEKEVKILAYLNSTFYGCDVTRETLDGLAAHIIDKKIVETTDKAYDKEYVDSIIKKYAIYSKKKDRYYFKAHSLRLTTT